MNAKQFARAQQKPVGPIKKLVRQVLHLLGIPVDPGETAAAAMLLYRPILRARDENYLAVVRYLRDEAPEIVPPPPHDYPLEAVTTTIQRVVERVRFDGEPVTPATRTDIRAIEAVRPALEGPLTRDVLNPTRETIADIGEDEEYPHYGWARVLNGAYSCAFCAMLASRGAVYTSEARAKGRGGNPLDLYHTPYPNKNGKIVGGNCDCSVVQVFRDEYGTEKPWEGQQAWLALEDLWQNAEPKERKNGKRQTKTNAFREVWEKQVRAGQTQIYLPESLKRKPAA